MLSEYPDGYTKAQTLWEEVQPLYKKLHNFVKVRIEKYYKITQNTSTIPVYLLGKLKDLVSNKQRNYFNTF